MKNCKSCLSTGLLILRFLIGGIFLYHGITKFGAGAGMIEFIGGAFHNAGLTFFSMAARVTILGVAEVVIGAMFILGLFPRVAAIAVVIIMLGAMNTKGRAGTTFVEKDFMLAIIAIVLFATGAGSYSLTAACCGEACDTENK